MCFEWAERNLALHMHENSVTDIDGWYKGCINKWGFRWLMMHVIVQTLEYQMKRSLQTNTHPPLLLAAALPLPITYFWIAISAPGLTETCSHRCLALAAISAVHTRSKRRARTHTHARAHADPINRLVFFFFLFTERAQPWTTLFSLIVDYCLSYMDKMPSYFFWNYFEREKVKPR